MKVVDVGEEGVGVGVLRVLQVDDVDVVDQVLDLEVGGVELVVGGLHVHKFEGEQWLRVLVDDYLVKRKEIGISF